MNILIQDEECWICGKTSNIKGDITIHHCLPRHLNPKKNVLVPICKECHDKLNADDVQGLQAFAFKIHKTLKDMKSMSAKFYSNVMRKLIKKNKKEGYAEDGRDTYRV